jgi:hypothetical protein
MTLTKNTSMGASGTVEVGLHKQTAIKGAEVVLLPLACAVRSSPVGTGVVSIGDSIQPRT